MQESVKSSGPPYIKYRKRYHKYIMWLFEIYSENAVFDEKRCFKSIFRKRKKPKFIRFQILMSILVKKGILRHVNRKMNHNEN